MSFILEGRAVRTMVVVKVCVHRCMLQAQTDRKAAFVLILMPCSSLQMESNQAKYSEGRKSRSDSGRLQ